jgi:hypothetical protein
VEDKKDTEDTKVPQDKKDPQDNEERETIGLAAQATREAREPQDQARRAEST